MSSQPPGDDTPLRVVFMGTPQLAVPTLEGLAGRHHVVAVVTQPDRRAGRGRRVGQSPVKHWAEQAGLRVLQPARLREPDAIAALRRLDADVAVVVAFGQILPPPVLELPRLGCVNLHASLLPRFRGASPLQAAILAGDGDSGATTMLMDEGLDTGAILLQRRLVIRDDDTAGTLGERIGALGPCLVLDTLDGLASGGLTPVPQDEAAATTTRRIRRGDAEIDWCEPAPDIERRVRAMQPWPVAFTHHGDQELKVWEASTAAGSPLGASPGMVVAVEPGLAVACGGGTMLRIAAMQRSGGRRMPVADLLRGYPIAVGELLGAGA